MPAHSGDLELLEHAVRAAGDIARKYYGTDLRRWSKDGGSPVSEADLEVDRFLREALCGSRPDYGWLSEESVDDPARLTKARVFVVDPIDGTVAFLKTKPHFTICAAVVEQGRPIAGVVFNPITQECFSAASGMGARLNGAPIHISGRDELAGARMLGTKSVFAGWPVEVASYSSIAYRAALVAAGRYDAMVSLTVKHDWDLAAADLIVQEAGGLLTDQAGMVPRYNAPIPEQRATIAANPRLHALILRQLAQAG